VIFYLTFGLVLAIAGLLFVALVGTARRLRKLRNG
jgi:hypothetical protein